MKTTLLCAGRVLANRSVPSAHAAEDPMSESITRNLPLSNGVAAAADLAVPTPHPIHGRTFAIKNSISPQMQMMPATQDAHGVGERSAMQDWRVNRVQSHDYWPIERAMERGISGPHPAT
jgi:hypothetical protein